MKADDVTKHFMKKSGPQVEVIHHNAIAPVETQNGNGHATDKEGALEGALEVDLEAVEKDVKFSSNHL